MYRISDTSAHARLGGDPSSRGDWRSSGAVPQSREAGERILEFGRFRLFLRQCKLVCDGVPIKLGSRGYDLLLALLEADGALLTKDELFRRVWPGIVVAEENLKTQMSVLRKALGKDQDLIRTEFGRGYRFIGEIRQRFESAASHRTTPWHHCVARKAVWPSEPREVENGPVTRTVRLTLPE
jgi:DNA-binding winged helix-turn-helix (wHTH) protein